jgi:hypothetical protein
VYGAAARPKLDTLIMKNGDRITCEIMKLEFGQLHIKTSYTIGTTQIDWSMVERVVSPQRFVIETTVGEYFTGLLEKKADEEAGGEMELAVVEETMTTHLHRDAVVEIKQLERSFIGKLTGKVDYGFSFTRANKQTQSTLQGSLDLVTENYFTGVNVSSLFSGQESGSSTNRHNLNAFYYHFPFATKRWFVGGMGDFLVSDQQNLDLRSTLGGSLGRRFIRSNRNNLLVLGGAVWNSERYTPGFFKQEQLDSAEGMAMLRYSTFSFKTSELNTAVWVFPSFSDLGRVRINYDLSVYWKFIGDLYFRVTFWDNYDSRPPLETSKNDYGINTTIGWSF